ncbi:MAG: leucine-rich repeat protein, partial [Prevotella sp.]
IDITLQDESFKNCTNLETMGLVYLSHATTTRGSVKPLTPQTLRLGDRVFDDTPKLTLKMMPQQMEAFLADSAWASYKDKFAPCLFKPIDSKVKSLLSDLRYTLNCSEYNNTWDIIDALRLKEKGFSWLNGRFSKSDIEEFPEFKIFEITGLDYIGGSWFVNCSNLRNIELPSTIKTIGGYAFQNCTSLREITIPAAVEKIDEFAFSYTGLKTMRCESTQPATLGSYAIDPKSFDGFVIYVPAEAVDAYKTAWPKLAQYIKSAAEEPVIHYVKTDKVGELAEKLGLETIMDGKFLMGLKGQYQKFDSLVVEGPLNGIDVGVLRFLGGANVNNSEPTAGRLRYLNLYGAELKKDTEHPYQCWGSNDYLEEDFMVGDFMFTYCDKLRTIILPRTATKLGENVFEEAHGLKHLAVGDETVEADNELFEDIKAPLEELVFLGNVCTSDDKTCWSPGAEVVYVQGDNVGQFLGRNEITSSCQLVTAAFEDNEAMNAFTRKGHFFPSEYRQLTNIDGILNDKVKSFDEFENFTQITDLGSAFNGCESLERVTLPDSLRYMGYSAFQGCKSLSSITINADSVPTLEEGAFRDLPSDFRIYVPKTHAKRYRDAWTEYADHIAGNDFNIDDVIEVNLTAANTLGDALGLTVFTKGTSSIKVVGVEGDYNHITKLKVNGPISGGDIALMRYLAGFCAWSNKPNVAGQLEYIDLYDAQLVPSDYHFAQDKTTTRDDYVWANDVLPAYAFLQCYQLKTLILPKSLKEIRSRAIMQCESLETVVVGDSIETLNWSAFDDDVSLTRMYLLAKKKPEMDADNWVWRNLCNNYNPTFDAFYVRPSLYDEYVADDAYVGNSWQRTSNISTGVFKDDATFASFAAHAAATEDDLSNVTSVGGWFKENPDVADLTPLRYTLVDTLKTNDMQPLTKLERIAMPMKLVVVGDDAFSNAPKLRFADFQLSDSLDLMNNLKDGGLQRIGLTDRTICYMPSAYGETDEVNVAVGDSTNSFHAKTFRLYDDADYCVPIPITAEIVENTRTLAKSNAPYTVCLPYALEIPAGAKVYRLAGRSDNELIFAQHTERMEALQPYLVWAEQGDASLDTSGDVVIPMSGGSTYGRQQQSPGFVMRGTLDTIDNTEAVELGAYVMNDDAKWHPVLSDTEAHRAVTIPAFRCFLLQSRYNSR